MEITIASPLPKDLEEIQSFFDITIRHAFDKEGIAKSHADDIETEIVSLVNQFKSYLDNKDTNDYFLIAKIGKKIVGTIGCGLPNQIIKDNLDADLESIPEVKSVYILHEFQKQGIGNLLFDAIIKYFKNNKINKFCLDCGFTKSQPYWIKKIGKPTVVLKDYFGSGADHMIWLADVR